MEPLPDSEAEYVLTHLRHRVLRTRACYRDKSCGQGEVRAKCRIVALGHLDPDLKQLSRNSGTPGRVAEQILYLFLVAGLNKALFDDGHSWNGWLGDATTAFLQGVQDPSERSGPLFITPPKDGLIALTNTWTAKAYSVRGNIYGLANAPVTWQREVHARLTKVGYVVHSFDHQMYIKRQNGQPVSILIVYVDDFFVIARSDYDLTETHSLFQWGALQTLQTGVAATFKGKELTVTCKNGTYGLKIQMQKFTEALDAGSLPRGRLQQNLSISEDERKELRSINGCLQWASTQARPELAATTSLTGHGDVADATDLKILHEAVTYMKSTITNGIFIPKISINKHCVVLAYSDSSWANARKSGSQIGVLIGVTEPSVTSKPAPFGLIDWRSARSPRVCRSTLAAEACAADEAADRADYVNRFISEVMVDECAHRCGPQLTALHAVDARSLFDAIMSDNPTLNDRRTLVSVRAIQETVDATKIRWVPTHYQFADGLTKVDARLRDTFRRWLLNPIAILVESPLNTFWDRTLQLGQRNNTSEKVMQDIDSG